MEQKKVYDEEFKIQAVKQGREIGFGKATIELGVRWHIEGGVNHTLMLVLSPL